MSCGGRVGSPVAATTPYDDKLDCAHLQAEKSVNVARMADLLGERDNDVRNNLGMLLLNPLFLNLSDTEQKEITAFQARNQVLDGLITQRCAIPL
jgi:hypothetical protein